MTALPTLSEDAIWQFVTQIQNDQPDPAVAAVQHADEFLTDQREFCKVMLETMGTSFGSAAIMGASIFARLITAQMARDSKEVVQ